MRALVLLALAACSGQRLNVPPMEAYVRKLLPGVTIERCAMFGDTRKGFCLVRGDLAALGLSVTPPSTVYGTDACQAMAPFGQPDGTGYAPAPGTLTFKPGPLPGNHDNVWLRLVVTHGERACLELEYPYG